jgi:hypothetical protein
MIIFHAVVMKYCSGMRIARFPGILVLYATLSLSLVNVGYADAASEIGFAFRPDRQLMQKIPAISLTDGERSLLCSGKPVTRLLDTPGGLKAGYMRIFLPFDPPTIWQIFSDVKHFSHVSPQYPNNGSFTDKRRTFMPYVFDSAACEKDRYLYQLLVLPFIAPRQYTLKRHTNQTTFPWESHWVQESGMRCQDRIDTQMDKYRMEAITTLRNEGYWYISPLPQEFIRSRDDLRKTDCVYYVNSNPGGNLSSLMAIINKVTEITLPALVENLTFHAKHWEDHMKDHHTPQQYDDWKAQVKAYLAEVGYASNPHP